MLVDVHHHGKIGAAIAQIDDVVMTDAEGRADLFQHSDFAPAGGGPNDGVNFSGGFIITKTRAEDVFGRNNAFEGGLDNLQR